MDRDRLSARRAMWDCLSEAGVRDGVTLEHEQDGERELTLDAAGRLTVTELGDPRPYRGLAQPRQAEIRQWHARVPADRLDVIVAGLRVSGDSQVERPEAFGPSASGASSLLRVRGGGVELTFDLHALRLDVPPAFARAAAEVRGLSQLCATHMPCAWFANPLKSDVATARTGALASAVKRVRRAFGWASETKPLRTDRAAERALQDAVDRFYAEWPVEPLPVEPLPVATEPAAIPKPSSTELNASAPSPVLRMRDAERVFRCAEDPEAVAGVVTLRVGARPMWLEVSGFAPVPRTGRRVDPRDADVAADALEREDAAALHQLDPEIAPFFCPRCERCYAGARWRTHELSPSKVDGTCPRGHTRPLCRD